MTAFIHGTSGVGKTRLDLELLRLLREHASRPEFEGHSEIQQLRQFLEESKTVVLDIRHNGTELTRAEAKWPADVILGLRLARQYWFPDVSYTDLRQAVMERAYTFPGLLDTFKVGKVLDGIRQKPAAPTPNDPSPRIPRMLHIAVDEVQHAFSHSTPYQGVKFLHAEEPLSTALNLALVACVSGARGGLFVLGTLSGTSARHEKEVLDPTDAESVGVLVSPLSLEAARRVVESFKWQTESGLTVSGADWLAFGRPFDRLLSSLGGNARALECLEQVLKSNDPLPESISLHDIFTKLTYLVFEKFNIASWGRQGSGRFGLLLALAGIPVDRDLVISPPDSSESVTVADLERAGLVHLRPPPAPINVNCPSWMATWQVRKDEVVMEVPLVMVTAALMYIGRKLVKESTLFSMADKVLNEFYPDAATFEKFTLRHRVLRHNVASEFALRQKQNYVKARDLFCGTICDQAFTNLRFKPERSNPEIRDAPAAGVWCRSAQLYDLTKRWPPAYASKMAVHSI